MTTFPKALRLTMAAKHPENRVRGYHAGTGPHAREAWPPEPDLPKPKTSLGSLFELLCLYK